MNKQNPERCNRPGIHHQHPTEEPVNDYTQDALFPDSAVQTEGWAQPETRNDADDDTVAEAA
ncbi:hypothetical protein ACIGXF_16805 [Streptomyces sp. NPDC053086]|uniref:hypothetical protein n=1 Tax=unclassified Streptomyces TaxID=2593676 RepID=UPI0037D10ACD